MKKPAISYLMGWNFIVGTSDLLFYQDTSRRLYQ